MNLAYHAADNWSIFLLYDLGNLTQSKCYESALLINRSANLTFDLFDFYLSSTMSLSTSGRE